MTALCEITVAGRFANGEERQARMVAQFDRDCAGHLYETIAMYETRERPQDKDVADLARSIAAPVARDCAGCGRGSIGRGEMRHLV